MDTSIVLCWAIKLLNLNKNEGKVVMSLHAFVRNRVEPGSLTWQRLLVSLGEQIFNRSAALLLLIIGSPLMIGIIILIWRRDGGPTIFGHYRVGKSGKLFRCFKFRTMVKDSEQQLARILRTDPEALAEWTREQKLLNDPRVTPIGSVLRQTSLDELPQLLNVIRGEMNLVGPRPITVAELGRYGVGRWEYLSVRPGLTGLWQVSGRNEVSYEERIAMDRRYVNERNIILDLKILVRTIGVVLNRRGAR